MKRPSKILLGSFGVFLIGTALLTTGVGFSPFLRWLERTVARSTPFTLSIERAHLTFSGDLRMEGLALSRETVALASVTEVVIDPRWFALLRGAVVIDRINVSDPLLSIDGNWSTGGSSGSAPGKTFARGLVVNQLVLENGRLHFGQQDTFPVDLGPMGLSASWVGTELELQSLSVVLGDGVLHGSGRVSLDTQTLNLKGTTESFPFDQLARTFVPVPETVHVRHTGDWAWAGTLAQWTSHLNGQIENGITPDQTIESAIRASFKGPEGEIEANLSHPRADVWGKGALNLQKKYLDADFKMAVSSFPAFKALWENLAQVSGSVSLDGRVAGDWKNPGGSVHLVGDGMGYHGFGVQGVRADFERKTKGPSPLRLKVMGSSVTWVKTDGGVGHLPRGEGTWAGTETQGNLQWNVLLAQGIAVGGQGPAHRTNGGMGWAWNQLAIHFPQGNAYAADPGGSIERDATGGIAITGLRWGKNGQSLRFKTLGYENGTVDVEAFAENVGFNIPTSPTDPESFFSGRLTATVRLKGPLENPDGKFDMTLSSGGYGSFSPVDVFIQGIVGGETITLADVRVQAESLPPVHLRGTVPWAWVLAEGKDQSLDLTLDPIQLDPARLLKHYPEATVGAGGSIRLDGRVRGRPGAFSATGGLFAFVPMLKIKTLGMDLTEIRLDLNLVDRHLEIRQAEAQSKKGFLRLSGGSTLPDLRYDLEGKNVSLRIPRRLALKTDLQAQVRGTLAAPILSGDIRIAEGTYESDKKKSKESPVENPQENLVRVWDRLQMNVTTVWDNNVWYRDGLSKIETRADLEVTKEAGNRMPGIRGMVTVLRGNYDAYGKDFVLKNGELAFMNPSEINPQVNIQATHKMKDHQIELTVSGTAKQPELHFQSTPPLPEQDILALLALGQVPGQSSGEKGESSATDLAATMASDMLTREIRSAGMNVLDLDVVRVSPSDKGTEWTVGRYWGSKLFLSYSYNPADSASQVIKGEYSISPQWYLVGQTGSQSDNYLDINFRLPVGKGRKRK